jgi:hypothetical protein
MARYGKRAQKSVKRSMHKRKKGTLKSGKSGKPVKSRKQAIAIGLSEARRKGAKVPKKKAAYRSLPVSNGAALRSASAREMARSLCVKRPGVCGRTLRLRMRDGFV